MRWSPWQRLALLLRAPRLIGIFAALAASLTFAPALAQTEDTETAEPRTLATDHGSWTGDFKGMVERRLVRIAVPYSRSLFYHDRGRERGLTAESVRKFEEHINKNTGRTCRSGRSRW